MIKAVIIDDEQMARDTIELLIKNHAPNLVLVGKARSVDEGVSLIHKHKPQLIFLDIQMPEKNGFALFDQIDTSQLKIIFTTAHSEYAIKAINLSASYYLLKPISPLEFKHAVEIVTSKLNLGQSDQPNIEFLRELLQNPIKYSTNILVNSKNGYERVTVSDIRYLEGDKNYTWIFTSENKFLATRTLKDFEEILNPEFFYRSHQSHIVNKAFIKRVLNTKPDQIELTDGTIINLSRDKKKQFLEWLSK